MKSVHTRSQSGPQKEESAPVVAPSMTGASALHTTAMTQGNASAQAMLSQLSDDGQSGEEGGGRAFRGVGQGKRGPLPFREEMEEAFGRDFLDVEAYFGAGESLDEIDAVAATHGAVIEFADENPDKDTVAHELTHVVQDTGGGSADQMSSASDSSEVEATDVAKRVVAGEEAGEIKQSASGVHRKGKLPSNSYNRGELKWEGGTALTEQEYKAWWDHKSKAVSAAMTVTTKLFGISGMNTADVTAKLVADAEGQINANIETRGQEVAFFASQIEGMEERRPLTNKEEIALKKLRLRHQTAELRLDIFKKNRESALRQATETASTVASGLNDSLGAIANVAGAFNGQLMGVNTAHFRTGAKALDYFDKAVEASSFIVRLGERTQLQNFQENPNFETAAAWGAHVGQVCQDASAFVVGFPMGWGDVIQGALQMPTVVIAGFTSVMRTHRAKLDAALHADKGCGSEVLEEGQSSCS